MFFLLEAAWLNEVRCPGGRPSVSWWKWKKVHLRWWFQQALHLNNKNLKKHKTNRGKERRQPHRGCRKQQHSGKPASTIWSRDILARQLAGDRDHACQMVQSGFVVSWTKLNRTWKENIIGWIAELLNHPILSTGNYNTQARVGKSEWPTSQGWKRVCYYCVKTIHEQEMKRHRQFGSCSWVKVERHKLVKPVVWDRAWTYGPSTTSCQRKDEVETINTWCWKEIPNFRANVPLAKSLATMRVRTRVEDLYAAIHRLGC